MRTVGAVVRGIRTPIVREGDDLVTLVRDSVMAASETEHITFHDRDIVAVTESVVARAAGNYATVQNIADDVNAKFGCDHIGVIFPILSRNRFAIVLRGIYSTTYPAPRQRIDTTLIRFPDGAELEYDEAAHALTATLPFRAVTVAPLSTFTTSF